ncbi:hypothetical protein FGL86_04720 [Pistricoccus aurantiacus]|uniref:Uncharacterized protein n=1 Tax=Pistricoccus aurantiacus TaxID=1883414 RepID=A0A5B8SN17_9GAMM|nr:hypothetical protein [Pistricoccus aurantiacus]QEA38449.1 hypothetical protein FGL86_04720 [Pistricoccus aurantiacus]
MTAIIAGFFVVLYVSLGVAMHFLWKSAAHRQPRSNRVCLTAVVSKRQMDGRVGGINMAPFADWSSSATQRVRYETDRGGVIAPFAR